MFLPETLCEANNVCIRVSLAKYQKNIIQLYKNDLGRKGDGEGHRTERCLGSLWKSDNS
jgi:hypothetical protein